MTTEFDESKELDLLKERAKKMGITFSNNIGLEKLREKVAEALKEDEPEEKPEPMDAARKLRLAAAAKRKKVMDKAAKLVRVRITCHNPAKREWPGEIITAGNDTIGTFRKMVPFDGEPYHVPQIILNVLEERQYQKFETIKLPNGETTRRGKLEKEFGITILPALTKKEIEDLASDQKKAGGV